jgi:ppGpp synthetase/RelA/SpoT-type nucleotidyltranferase
MSLSQKQLKDVGRALAAGSMTAEQRAQLDALLTLADQAALSAEVTAQAALNASWPDAKLVVRGRAKSKETLAEKLNRMGAHALPIIRDLAGIRVVGKMSRRQQDQVMSDACRALGCEKPKLIDRRETPSFGYRALHAELVSSI